MNEAAKFPDDLTDLELEKLNKVASLFVRGKTTPEIAKALSIGPHEVNKLQKLARLQRLQRAKTSCEEIIAEDLRKLEEIEKECWIEWDRSKRRIRELSKEHTDKETGDEGDREVTVKSKQILKERIAEAKFFDLMLKAMNKRHELTGVGASKAEAYQDIALVEVVIEDRSQLPEVMDYGRFLEMKNSTVDGKVVYEHKAE